MNTLGDVKNGVRAILGDPDGDWITDAYVVPIINQIYNLAVLRLLESCSPYITKLVTIPNLPIGTTDLAAYQNDKDKPLFGLVNPLEEVDWKIAGMPESWYRRAIHKDVLPDVPVSPGGTSSGGGGGVTPGTGYGQGGYGVGPYGGTPGGGGGGGGGSVGIPGAIFPIGRMYWEWRAYIMYVTPMGMPIDLRVRGEFRPSPLINDNDSCAIHPLMDAALVELSSAAVMRERANPGQMEAYELPGTSAIDSIGNQLVRSQQGTTVRLGRANGNGLRGYYRGGSW